MRRSYLVPLQCVLPRECLPTSAVAEERLLARVRVAMALEVVLPIERQRAHVARERARGRSRIQADPLSIRSLGRELKHQP